MYDNKRNEHCFVFSIDNNYIQPFRVVIYSLFKNNTWISDETFFVLYSSKSLSLENKNELSHEFQTLYSIAINWIVCDSVFGNYMNTMKAGHVSISTYFRLFLNDLIPNIYNYALYLDSDILILGDIQNLFLFKPHKPVSAVDNYAASESIRLWGPKGGSYFNAGVICFNLKITRTLDMTNKYLQILNNPDLILSCWDQDVLNIVHEDNWERLDYSFNITRHLIQSFQIVNYIFFKKININEFKIIHYDGPLKPWDKKSLGIYDKYWLLNYNMLNNNKHPVDRRFIIFKKKIIIVIKSFKKSLRLFNLEY
jgi:lipopolysaccharide biosynthesis glycosyltransferase